MSIDTWKIAPVLESIAGVLTGPEDLPAFIEVLEQTDWPEVFARVAEMRARRLAKLEASYAHLPPAYCSECGRAFFGEDADQLLPSPELHHGDSTVTYVALLWWKTIVGPAPCAMPNI